jgi:myo-inositol-1(or 4)-monophosphatase
MNEPLLFAINLARQAGDLLCDRFHWAGVPAKSKDDSSVVTEADLAADRLITQTIAEVYPEDAILSEEANTTLRAETGSIWIIDPLDGTTNYSLGLPVWGVSIARITDGQPAIAAVYFPLLDELYSAQRASGAFRNGAPISVKDRDPKQTAAFFSCCTRTHRRYRVDVPYKTRILGSAAYSLCMVARGSALLAFEATPKIWDLAGGWLLVREAGGVIDTLSGSPPFPLRGNGNLARIEYPTLAAASASLAQQARSQIIPRDEATEEN